MKIIWFTNIMLPDLAAHLGLKKTNQGGWLPSLVDAVKEYAPTVKLTVVCEGPEGMDVTLGDVRYVTRGYARRGVLSRRPSSHFIAEIRRFINDEKPDLIHLHGTEGMWAALPKETWSGYPVVASLQGILNGCYTHYTAGLLPYELSSWKNWPNILLTRWSVYRGAMIWARRFVPKEKYAFSTIQHFLGRTDWDHAWTNYLAPTATYHHVGEILRPVFYEGGRSDKTIVPHSIFCGGACAYPLKGGHWLIKAVAALKLNYPDVKLRIANAIKVRKTNGMMAAIHQGEYHRYLSKLISELGLEENVDLLPSLTAEQVATELEHAEVFCLPSMCENSPNSLGEAMLMGCPCIATDVGGTESVLRKGEQGALVPSGDPAILAYWIDKLFSDKNLAAQFASAGQAFAKVRYDPHGVVDQLVNAYAEIIARK